MNDVLCAILSPFNIKEAWLGWIYFQIKETKRLTDKNFEYQARGIDICVKSLITIFLKNDSNIQENPVISNCW